MLPSVQNLLSSRRLCKDVKIKIYEKYSLPLVLCRCETLSFTLGEQRRWRVLENRVLRGVFGPVRVEEPGGWRQLHAEDRNCLYCAQNTSGQSKRELTSCRACRAQGRDERCKQTLVWKPEGQTPLGRPRRVWEGVGRLEGGSEPSGSIKDGECLE
jgi:hypothetical protein